MVGFFIFCPPFEKEGWCGSTGGFKSCDTKSLIREMRIPLPFVKGDKYL